MAADASLRRHLLNLLTAKNAHITLNDAIKDFPPEAINKKAGALTYTPWQLFEHIRLAQWDIWRFMIDADHVSPAFPEGYWPDRNREASWQDWQTTLQGIRHDLAQVVGLVQDNTIDLTSELPHAPGYTYLREILLVADHNAYHVGGFMALRRMLGL